MRNQLERLKALAGRLRSDLTAPAPAKAGWSGSVRTDVGPVLRIGLGATGIFVLVFGTWSFFAPLAGAAVAPGVVAAAGRNQRIQHLEGGRIQHILVHEGDRVTRDQPLFEMDRTRPEADRNRLRRQVTATKARIFRLAAERDGLQTIDFPEALAADAVAFGSEEALDEQSKEFTARLQGHRQEEEILRQRLGSAEEQVKGMVSQGEAVARQSAVVADELARKKALLDKGLANRTEYSALLRSEAELTGRMGEARSGELSGRSQISEVKERLTRLSTQRVETAIGELAEAREKLADLTEQVRTAEDVLARATVRSPSDGIVVRLAVNAEGSVVTPGESLMELLPTGDAYVVEARIAVDDVDAVSIGRTATLRFSSLNPRTTPTVSAKVSYMSADRTVDRDDPRPYYVARLSLPEELPPGMRREEIYPGMPVEVYVDTGARTFAQYLGKPLADSFSRAFREE